MDIQMILLAVLGMILVVLLVLLILVIKRGKAPEENPLEKIGRAHV